MVMASLYDLSHPVHERPEIDARDLGGHAEFFRFADFYDSIPRIDENLRRNSADVQTGSAGGAFVHQGRAESVFQGILDNERSAPGTDNDYIILFHDVASLLSGCHAFFFKDSIPRMKKQAGNRCCHAKREKSFSFSKCK
jgi:hypothetical protein